MENICGQNPSHWSVWRFGEVYARVLIKNSSPHDSSPEHANFGEEKPLSREKAYFSGNTNPRTTSSTLSFSKLVHLPPTKNRSELMHDSNLADAGRSRFVLRILLRSWKRNASCRVFPLSRLLPWHPKWGVVGKFAFNRPLLVLRPPMDKTINLTQLSIDTYFVSRHVRSALMLYRMPEVVVLFPWEGE